jgi:hypothetical protein
MCPLIKSQAIFKFFFGAALTQMAEEVSDNDSSPS